jgi:hypothetical protein
MLTLVVLSIARVFAALTLPIAAPAGDVAGSKETWARDDFRSVEVDR